MERFCFVLLIAVVLFVGSEAGAMRRDLTAKNKEIDLLEKLRDLLTQKKEMFGIKKEAASKRSSEKSAENVVQAENEKVNGGKESLEEETKFWTEACNFDDLQALFEDRSKVTAADIWNTFGMNHDMLLAALENFDEHSQDVEEIEANMGADDLDGFIEAHKDLANNIMAGFDEVAGEAFCSWAKLGILLMRIHLFGAEDVQRCTSFAENLFALDPNDEEIPFDAPVALLDSERPYNSIEDMQRKLAEYLRDDVKCIRAELDKLTIDDVDVKRQADPSHADVVGFVAGYMTHLGELGFQSWMLTLAFHHFDRIVASYKERFPDQEIQEKELNNLLDLLKKTLEH